MDLAGIIINTLLVSNGNSYGNYLGEPCCCCCCCCVVGSTFIRRQRERDFEGDTNPTKPCIFITYVKKNKDGRIIGRHYCPFRS